MYRSTFGVKSGLAHQTLKLTMASAKTESTLNVIYHPKRHLAHHLPVKRSKRHTLPQLQTHKASNSLRLYSRPHWFPSDEQYSCHHDRLSPKRNTNHSKVAKCLRNEQKFSTLHLLKKKSNHFQNIIYNQTLPIILHAKLLVFY